MIETVTVDLPGRVYDIRIGAGVLDEAGPRIAAMGGRRHMAIITGPSGAGGALQTWDGKLTAEEEGGE